MAREKERKVLKKGKASFNLIGRAKVTDKTFNLDNSYDSGWTDNQMYLGVDCGNGNIVYGEMRGGFFPDDDNILRGFSKTDKDDSGKSKMVEIAWEDRFDENLLDTISDTSFITVGVEKDVKEKTVYKKFLSAYDAVEYLNEHLEDGMIVNVKGNIGYSEYDENISVKKDITSIVLSKVENEYEKIHEAEIKKVEEEDGQDFEFTELEDFFKAKFSQTILLDSKSVGKKDKEKGTILLDAYVVDYVGNPKIDGKKVSIKQNVVYPKTFEIAVNENESLTDKMIQKYFKVSKKNMINALTVVGDLIEGGSIVNITEDDIPDDIKELIELGLYSEDEAKSKCAVGGNNREKRMIIVKPDITYVGDEENRKPTVALEEAKYEDTDLYFYEQALADACVNTEDDTNVSSDSYSTSEEDDLLAMLNSIN